MISFEGIVREVSYRCKSGKPDWKNKEHIAILSEVLSEYGYGHIKHEWIQNLIEGPNDGDRARSSAEVKKDELEDSKFYHKGNGIYVKSSEKDKDLEDVGNKYTKDDNGKFRPISDKEIEKIMTKNGEMGGSNNNPEAKPKDGKQPADVDNQEEIEAQQNIVKTFSDQEFQDHVKEDEIAAQEANDSNENDTKDDKKITPPGDNLPTNIQNVFDGNTASYRNCKDYMSSKDKQMFIEFGLDYKQLVNTTNKIDRRKIAEKMLVKYGLDTNKPSDASSPKLYMRNVSPDARKVLSGNGNKTSEEMRNTIEDALGKSLYGATKSGVNVKQAVTTTSKPDIGGENKEYIRTSESDPIVRNIFNQKPFSYLEDSAKQLMGPTDDTGNLLYPSSEHSKKYLEHSIRENRSLDTTIDLLKRLEASENVKPEIRYALESHKTRMQNILKSSKIPSEEASIAVGSSYAQLAESLTNESSVLANAMMKNIAEMVQYDTEIAEGKEVYLPSSGTFPAGDKIHIKRNGSGVIEKIKAVSVKYGKSGEYKPYGFPGETAQYQKFHPNVEYRDILHSRPGDDGYELGVKNEIINSPIKVKQLISDSGLDDVFTDTDSFISIVQEMQSEIQKIKSDIGYIQNSTEARREGKPAAKKQLGAQKDKIRKIEKKLASKMKQYINIDRLNELVGKDNARTMISRPQTMICGISFAAILATSNGLDVIEHNHQEIKDGKFINHTDTSVTGQTQSIKNWHLTWRAYDDRAGGLIAGANSERINM